MLGDPDVEPLRWDSQAGGGPALRLSVEMQRFHRLPLPINTLPADEPEKAGLKAQARGRRLPVHTPRRGTRLGEGHAWGRDVWFSFAKLSYSKPHAKDKALWNVIKSIHDK